MAVDVIRAAKDIHQVDVTGNLRQPTIDSLTEDLRDLRIIDGHRDDLESGCREIFRHVERGLICLRFCLNAENSNTFALQNQLTDIRSTVDKIFLPAHVSTVAIDRSRI